MDTKSIKIASRSYNTIYSYPTPMYITKETLKGAEKLQLLKILVFQIILLGKIGQKWTFWAVLRPLEVNLTRKYPSDIYKGIVFQVGIDVLYPFI